MRKGQLHYLFVTTLVLQLVMWHKSDATCTKKEFDCHDVCIDIKYRCDKYKDCPNGNDEKDCKECADDQFKCITDQKCISKYKKCNVIEDCPDGSDELDCKQPSCSPNQFTCNDGTCIDNNKKCNFIKDCPDGSDEEKCPCTKKEFDCHDVCIDIKYRCDKYKDCPNGNDEKDCKECADDQFKCITDQKCISKYKKCNVIEDCPDGSDELDCKQPSCSPNQFTCNDGTCIDNNKKCNFIKDCPDGSDEEKCPCTKKEFDCHDVCIDIKYRCDKYKDCPNGNDEKDCKECADDQFKCITDQKCISKYKKCNVIEDCPDGSDELDCKQPSCSPNQFTCNDGTCIDNNKKCNFIKDCPDGSDEDKCPCTKKEFDCHDVCIDIQLRCDKFKDCLNGNDEMDCKECADDQFKCITDQKCISKYKKCNVIEDCPDGSDELDCKQPSCSPNQFTCNDGTCIDNNKKCNFIKDCPDGSDEDKCPCTKKEFDCHDVCIDIQLRCDKFKDCPNGNDEKDCKECADDQFKCITDQKCISKYKKCNVIEDCPDGSDELDCKQPSCSPNQFTCNDGTCIDNNKKCNFIKDCPDGSDEDKCPCTKNQFDCHDVCIDIQLRCDKYKDCLNGNDEMDCKECADDQFKCITDQKCISKYKKCNVIEDCPDGSDELDCKQPSCSPNQFTCNDGTCIDNNKKCDFNKDCPDGSDEEKCPDLPKEFMLKVNTRIIELTEGSNIVLTCKDEGRLRARVHWTRRNGVPLPPGSTDVDGRLTIPNVRIEDSGIYLCVVSDIFPDNTPNTKVPVSVTITPQPSNCNRAGSVNLIPNEQGLCKCKVNVEGNNCDRCRRGSFGLNSSSIDGCEFCFCSGIGSECSESDYYIEQIPYQIIELNHNFTITDQHFQTRFKDNFVVNDYRNEISHVFLPSNRETLYWSLPSPFTGNRIKSYGGKLEYSQMYTQRPQAMYVHDKDVIIYGNGITIFWSNPNEQRAEIVNSVSVHIHPTANWFRLEQNVGQRPASREDILTALAKVEYILIRATQSSDTSNAFLSDITLDTAVEQYTYNGKASSVEVCRCPYGYKGSSCERCDAGYYRNQYVDESRPLGTCSKCPCNDNEETCELGPNQRVVCHCKPEFTGPNCENEVPHDEIPRIALLQAFVDVNEGQSMEIQCVGSGVPAPEMSIVRADGRPLSSRQSFIKGIFYIYKSQLSDSGEYTCIASNRVGTDYGRFTILVHKVSVGSNIRVKISIITTNTGRDEGRLVLETPRLEIYPSSSQTVMAGNNAVIQCRAVAGIPSPKISWSRENNSPLSTNVEEMSGGFLRFLRITPFEEGEYICKAVNQAGSATASAHIVVHTPPEIIITPISKLISRDCIEDSLQLQCKATGTPQPSVVWSKYSPMHNTRLQYTTHHSNKAYLNFKHPTKEHEGIYVCKAESSAGIVERGIQLIVNNNVKPEAKEKYLCAVIYDTRRIVFNPNTYFIVSFPPRITLIPPRQVVHPGEHAYINCSATGGQPIEITWSPFNRDMPRSVYTRDGYIRFNNIQLQDTGRYLCTIRNTVGRAEAIADVIVEDYNISRPAMKAERKQRAFIGSNVTLRCRVNNPNHARSIRWFRERRKLPVDSQQGGETLYLRSVQSEDQGRYYCEIQTRNGKFSDYVDLILEDY